MENSFQIDIITPVKTINFGNSEYLRAPGLKGLFGVQSRHVSSIMSIDVGEIKITQNGKDHYFATNGGYADIKPEGVISKNTRIRRSRIKNKQEERRSDCSRYRDTCRS